MKESANDDPAKPIQHAEQKKQKVVSRVPPILLRYYRPGGYAGSRDQVGFDEAAKQLKAEADRLDRSVGHSIVLLGLIAAGTIAGTILFEIPMGIAVGVLGVMSILAMGARIARLANDRAIVVAFAKLFSELSADYLEPVLREFVE